MLDPFFSADAILYRVEQVVVLCINHLDQSIGVQSIVEPFRVELMAMLADVRAARASGRLADGVVI